MESRLGEPRLFLHRLPGLTERLPSYDDSNKDLLLLYPLFARDDGTFFEFYLRSALWSKHSYLTNSNAIEKKIPIKFYMESRVYTEYAEPYGLREKDCLLFENPYTPNPDLHSENLINLGLCLYPMLDDRLANYKKVMILDADLFLCRKQTDIPKYDIEKLVNIVPNDKIGARNLTRTYRVPRPNWLNKMKDANFDVWTDAVKQVFGIENPVAYFQDNKGSVVNGVFYIVPNDFYSAYPEFRDCIERAIPVFRDDEGIMGLWHTFNNGSIFPLRDGIHYYRYVEDSLNADGFYFCHLTTYAEREFYASIGAEGVL